MRRLAHQFIALLLFATIGFAATACASAAPTTPTAPAAASPLPATGTATAVPIATAPPPATAPPTPVATSLTGSSPPTELATATRAGRPVPGAADSPTPTNVAGPPVVPTAPPPAGPPAAETPHYRFYDPEGAHGDRIATLATTAEQIYAAIGARTGLAVTAPIVVTVQTPAASSCAARGVAEGDAGRIGLFADARTPRAQLLAVFAHETVHILHFVAVGDVRDPTLGEGFANWAILPYWSAWQGFPSFEDAVRTYQADGRFVSLDNPPADCTILRRDVIYNQRASFVGYLIATYGLDRLLAASATGLRAPGSSLGVVAEYEAVYGKGFAQLIEDWLAWVRAAAGSANARGAGG